MLTVKSALTLKQLIKLRDNPVGNRQLPRYLKDDEFKKMFGIWPSNLVKNGALIPKSNWYVLSDNADNIIHEYYKSRSKIPILTLIVGVVGIIVAAWLHFN